MNNKKERERILPPIVVPYGVEKNIIIESKFSKRIVINALQGYSSTPNAMKIREIAIKRFNCSVSIEPTDGKIISVVKIVKKDGTEKIAAVCSSVSDATGVLISLMDRSANEGFAAYLCQYKDGVLQEF